MTTPTTAPASRRRASARRTPPWPALLAVLVTAAALFLAGRAGLPPRPGVNQAGAPVQVDRTLVCPGGLPAATVESGTPGQAGVKTQTLPETSPTTLQVVTPAGGSSSTYATQVATDKRWLATTPCAEPRSDWWFVGVGGSGSHSSRVQVANPRSGDAVIDVEVYGPQGRVASPGLRGLFVPHGSTKALDLTKLAPATGDLAVHVTTSRGLVTVAASDSLTPNVIGKPLREWVSPQPGAARDLTLTGLPGKPSSAILLITNPADVEVLAEVKAIGSKGTFSPKENATVRVPPGAVKAVPVQALFDGKPLAIGVHADTPVAATVRSVVSGDESYAGAGGQPADGAALGVPGGVQAEVRASTLGKAGTLTVTSYDARGKQLAQKELSVAAASTAGLALPKGTRSVVVGSPSSGLVAGLVVTGGGVVGSAVFETPVQAARTPEVRPAG